VPTVTGVGLADANPPNPPRRTTNIKKTLVGAVLAATTLGFGTTALADSSDTIVENGSASSDLSTLMTALSATGLAAPFDSCDDAPMTVFAPTNDAINEALAALGLTAAELLADTDLATSILTYHVVPGTVMAADVVELDSATTLQGGDISIAVSGGNVVLNGSATVVTADIESCNGVVHVIDAVLLPQSLPATGTDSRDIALLAVGIAMLGTIALGVSRRRVTV